MNRSLRQAMIDRGHKQLSLVHQCTLLNISRASVYYRPVSTRAEDLELMARMDRQYLKTPFYGSRRMKAWLLAEGYLVSRSKVRRLMRLMGLEAIYRRPNTMDTDFCVTALEAALGKGRPEVFNTDQGAQFTSDAFTQTLQERGIRVSMDGKGRYLDTPVRGIASNGAPPKRAFPIEQSADCHSQFTPSNSRHSSIRTAQMPSSTPPSTQR